MPSGMQPQGVPAWSGDVSDPALLPLDHSAFVGGMGAGKVKDMSQRNRRVQRAARQQLVNDGGLLYTDARAQVRRGTRVTGLAPARSMLADGVWSRYGRWIHGTDDWTRWRFRCGACGHVQSPAENGRDGEGTRPETVLWQCAASQTPASACPTAGESADHYKVFGYHGLARVFLFDFAGDRREYPPLTEADDEIVEVPGVTGPAIEPSAWGPW